MHALAPGRGALTENMMSLLLQRISRRFPLFLALLATSPLSPAGAQAAADLADQRLRDELRQVIGAARDRVFPALVSIRVVTVLYSQGKEFKNQAVGSGTIISPDGHVVTNQHVVVGGHKFICTLSDKQEVSATLVGEDPLTDLAVLKLDTQSLSSPPPVASFGDSDALEIGDYVMAMGSPFSLSRSVSLGIVSNTERVFAGGFGSDDVDEMELESGQRTGLFTRWIQHDAVINPGNSGGPLVNLTGEIVGVNELGGSAMGFAIPSNLARKVADALIAFGEVPRSSLGLSFKPIQHSGLAQGALISSVTVGGPAARAEIEAGDVLLELAGEPSTVRFPEEIPLLLRRIADLPIGAPVALTVRRKDDVRTVTLATEKLEKDLGEETSFPAWGVTALEITSKMARDFNLDSVAGALISGVSQGGPAQLAEPPLAEGDVVRQVNGEPIADLAALIARYQQLREQEGKPQPLLCEFDRRGKNQLTLLEPRKDDREEPPRELPKAWIGVATQPLLPRLAAQLGLSVERGFRITRVYPTSEAAKAKFAVGDVILALNGERLEPNGMQDAALWTRRVQALDIGETASVTVLRQGQELTLPVVLERTHLTPDEARRHQDRDFELTVRELTFFDRDENRWPEELGGVLVDQVETGGWAGLGGIQPGDLLLRMGDRKIRGLKSFREALEEILRQQPERVVFLVLRGAKTHFQFIEPDWQPAKSNP